MSYTCYVWVEYITRNDYQNAHLWNSKLSYLEVVFKVLQVSLVRFKLVRVFCLITLK